MAIWSRLTAGIAGVAIGSAGAAAVEPVIEVPKQDAWKAEPNRVLGLGELAQLVAQGLVELGAATDEAARNGFNESRLRAAVQLELEAAPVAELLELWRRGKITEALVDHGLAKAKIEEQYHEPLKELYNGRLQAPTVALAVQRGVMRNATDPATGEPLLPVGPTQEVGRVAPMPVSALDPLDEARSLGIDFDRLAVMARNAGLSPAPGELLQLLNRGAIELADYHRGISEGDTRNEWANVLLELRRRLLTPHEYAELRLRGWIDTPAMLEGARLTGLHDDDTTLLFKLLGRPIPVHQVTTGLARGGTFGGPIDAIPEAYIRSLEEGNQRPEWYSLSYANRYSLPAPFVMRALTKDGTWSLEKAHQRLLEAGWIPEDALEAATSWASAAPSKAKPLTEAQVLRLYRKKLLPELDALARLEALGISAADAELLILEAS